MLFRDACIIACELSPAGRRLRNCPPKVRLKAANLPSFETLTVTCFGVPKLVRAVEVWAVT